MNELLPCPFCGAENDALTLNSYGDTNYVQCEDCLMEGPVKETPEEARAAWNRRVTPDVKEQENAH